MTNEEESPLALLLRPPGAVAALGSVLAVVYSVTGLLPAGAVHRLWHMFELSPVRAFRAAETGAYFSGVVRPYLGHMLFHINLTHLLVNLFAVVMCGSFVHREMEIQAAPRRNDAPAAFIAFFLVCGLAGGFGFTLADPNSAQSMVGASGAAAGLFGACAWILVMRFGGGEECAGYFCSSSSRFCLSPQASCSTIRRSAVFCSAAPAPGRRMWPAISPAC